MIKLFFKLILIVLVFWIVFLNLKLLYQPTFSCQDNLNYKLDLLYQLNHLEKQMHAGAHHEMQMLYPEGLVFMSSLYGLTWCNFLQDIPKETDLYRRGIKEIGWSLSEISSEHGKAPFVKELSVPYGAFYTGWSNYLLGRFLSIQTPEDMDSLDFIDFKTNCNSISKALEKSKTPFLASYPEMCWPADMTVGLASLALHDRIFPPAYEATIQNWLCGVEKRTDQYSLIPHAVNPAFGIPLESSRGSSQSLILNFLIEIDSVYANEKFEIYDSLFLDTRMGLSGIREYPRGSKGAGDIDSGPVIWGIGGAASLVGQRTMARYGKDDVSIGVRNSIEAFGISMKSGDEKKYLFGMLPIADVFIAWSNSIESTEKNALQSNNNWRNGFQIRSVCAVIVCMLILFLLWRK